MMKKINYDCTFHISVLVLVNASNSSTWHLEVSVKSGIGAALNQSVS